MKVEVHHYILSIAKPPHLTAKIDEIEVDDAVLEKIDPSIRLFIGVRPILMRMGYRVRFFSQHDGVYHAVVGDIRPDQKSTLGGPNNGHSN